MPLSISKPGFPPNVPEKLIAEFHAAAESHSQLARCLGINKAHVWNLMVHGKEPKRKDLREKLFLPAKVRENVPAWVVEATDHLANLEAKAPPVKKRYYNRLGQRVR